MQKGCKEFDEPILEEGGFVVELSNGGKRLKTNPLLVENRKEGNKFTKCVICGSTTHTHAGICENHAKYKKNQCIVCGNFIETDSQFCEEHEIKNKKLCIVCGEASTDNNGFCLYHGNRKNKRRFKNKPHLVDWMGRIIVPEHSREDSFFDVSEHAVIADALLDWANNNRETNTIILDEFVDDVLNSLIGEVPDSTSLQNSYAGYEEITTDTGKHHVITPYEVIKMIRSIVDRHFPEENFKKVLLNRHSSQGKPWKNIPLRIVAALFVAAFACEEANQGDFWYRKIHFKDEKKKLAKQTGCYMSAGHFFYRRHTDKRFHHMISMCLKGIGYS